MMNNGRKKFFSVRNKITAQDKKENSIEIIVNKNQI